MGTYFLDVCLGESYSMRVIEVFIMLHMYTYVVYEVYVILARGTQSIHIYDIVQRYDMSCMCIYNITFILVYTLIQAQHRRCIRINCVYVIL